MYGLIPSFDRVSASLLVILSYLMVIWPSQPERSVSVYFVLMLPRGHQVKACVYASKSSTVQTLRCGASVFCNMRLSAIIFGSLLQCLIYICIHSGVILKVKRHRLCFFYYGGGHDSLSADRLERRIRSLYAIEWQNDN